MSNINVLPLSGTLQNTIIGLLVLAPVAYLIRQHWRLRHIPGPFLASLSDLQRAYWVQTGRCQEVYYDLHSRYGDFVRLGPSMVSISDPNLMSAVYPIRPGIPKGEMYRSLTPYSPKGKSQPLVFNTRDETLHMQMKKPVAPLFSLTSVLKFEHHVDDMLRLLFQQLDWRFSVPNLPFDLSDWLQYFAFEAISTMTLSRQWGYLEKGCDHNGLLASMWKFISTAAPLTQIPWLDLVIYKNPVAAYFRPTSNMAMLHHVRQSIEGRKNMKKGTQETEQDDFLSRYIDVQASDSSLPPWVVTAWTFSNLVAGSDSTGTMMKTIWHNLLSHPTTATRLYQELSQNDVSRPFPKWREIATLPYLEACVNEAIRLEPAFGLPFERVVPLEGAIIGGRFLPGGTIIGMSPWVVNRHQPTFGEDSDQWRPDRWLVEGEPRRLMENSVLTFGAGRRTCLGKNVAIMEMKKLTAALMLNYEIKLHEAKFKSDNRWLLRQWGLNVLIKRRE